MTGITDPASHLHVSTNPVTGVTFVQDWGKRMKTFYDPAGHITQKIATLCDNGEERFDLIRDYHPNGTPKSLRIKSGQDEFALGDKAMAAFAETVALLSAGLTDQAADDAARQLVNKPDRPVSHSVERTHVLGAWGDPLEGRGGHSHPLRLSWVTAQQDDKPGLDAVWFATSYSVHGTNYLSPVPEFLGTLREMVTEHKTGRVIDPGYRLTP